MKKFALLFASIMMISGTASAQIINNQLNNQTNSTLNNNQLNSRSRTTTIPLGQAQGVRIKSLEERRQEQYQKTQEQLKRSGVTIQQIPNPQQGRVMNISPNNLTPAQAGTINVIRGNATTINTNNSGTVNTGN